MGRACRLGKRRKARVEPGRASRVGRKISVIVDGVRENGPFYSEFYARFRFATIGCFTNVRLQKNRADSEI